MKLGFTVKDFDLMEKIVLEGLEISLFFHRGTIFGTRGGEPGLNDLLNAIFSTKSYQNSLRRTFPHVEIPVEP